MLVKRAKGHLDNYDLGRQFANDQPLKCRHHVLFSPHVGFNIEPVMLLVEIS